MTDSPLRMRFHYELYSSKAIETACEIFHECGTFSREEDAPYYMISVVPSADEDPDEIVREFTNYVLGLTIEERRAG